MKFENLCRRGTEFLGTRYPIICGAMSWISDSDLVSAVSNAGGFGVFAAAHIPGKDLVVQMDEIRKKTNKPFGMNLITISPIFQEQLDSVLEASPSHVVFAGRIPMAKSIEQAKKKGAKVMTFAPNLKAAQKLINDGVDALIIEGHEAGGHVGSVSTLVLLQEILFNIQEVPVFVAGGIATGKMTAYLALMGASGIQLGTRFMLSPEANIHEKTKQYFLKSDSKDAIVSFGIDRRLGVVPVRTIKNKGFEEFTKTQIELVQKLEKEEITRKEATDEIEKFWIGALRKAVKEGDLEYGSLMAGNCVGIIHDIKPVQAIINDLVSETDLELSNIKDRAKKIQ